MTEPMSKEELATKLFEHHEMWGEKCSPVCVGPLALLNEYGKAQREAGRQEAIDIIGEPRENYPEFSHPPPEPNVFERIEQGAFKPPSLVAGVEADLDDDGMSTESGTRAAFVRLAVAIEGLTVKRRETDEFIDTAMGPRGAADEALEAARQAVLDWPGINAPEFVARVDALVTAARSDGYVLATNAHAAQLAAARAHDD